MFKIPNRLITSDFYRYYSTGIFNQTVPLHSYSNINVKPIDKIKDEIVENYDKIPTLVGNLVKIRPMKREDRDEMLMASSDGELWNLKFTVVPGPSTIDKYIDTAYNGIVNGTVLPFVIISKETGKIIGSTRYWKLDRVNRKVEIGHTWLSESVQRSGINTECKYLLLKHAFEDMNSVRVQFTTDVLNEKSQYAILRIGAIKEGIIRHERIMPDGRKRNSVRYSIIDSEWENVKLNLENKIKRVENIEK